MNIKRILLLSFCFLLLLLVLYLVPGVQKNLPVQWQYQFCSISEKIKDIRKGKKDYRSNKVVPPNFRNLRWHLLQALKNALYKKNFIEAAKINSYLASEAFARAKATLKFWMQQQDPSTKLFPGYLRAKIKFWDYRNVGADLFPFLVIGAYYLDDAAYAKLIETLKSEEQISDQLLLPRTVLLGEGKLIDEGIEEQVFGTSEYIKDCLIPLTERLGQGLWFKRMEFLMDKLWIITPHGNVPSESAEVNGEFLQALCRLHQATQKDNYLAWAERIGDAYLLEIIPQYDFLPPKKWDHENGRAESGVIWLRDHGNELIAGLTELVCLECLTGRERCDKYLPPLLKMMDLLLEKGRNEDGMWLSAIDQEGRPIKAKKGDLCDNWGYLYVGYLTISHTMEVMGTNDQLVKRYVEEVRRCLENIHKYKYVPWERDFEMDGLADSLESAIYLLNRIPVKSAYRWMDEEISTFFSFQKPDGSINKDYLDGNFIRTALLYGFYKTQGVYLKPYREDLYLGANRSHEELYLHLECDKSWKGKLYFDFPRHRVYLNSIINYPRVNEWPEWYVVEENVRYRITDLNDNISKVYEGKDLLSGIDILLCKHCSQDLLVERAAVL